MACGPGLVLYRNIVAIKDSLVTSQASPRPAAPSPAWRPKAKGDESFPVAWLLPPSRRPAVRAFYALARTADDIADAPDLAVDTKLARLNALDRALATGDGGEGEAVAVHLHRHLTARGLEMAMVAPLFQAFRADAEGIACADWAALMAYCDRSAVPVGRFLLALFGEAAPRAVAASDALCRALQVLNHVQDCGEDWRRLGRCYLPERWRAAEGCPAAALGAAETSPALRRVLARTLEATDALLTAAAALPAHIASRPLRAQAAATLTVARALRGHLGRGDPLARRLVPRPADWATALAVGLGAGLGINQGRAGR
jgi:squalene synthase HpnC